MSKNFIQSLRNLMTAKKELRKAKWDMRKHKDSYYYTKARYSEITVLWAWHQLLGIKSYGKSYDKKRERIIEKYKRLDARNNERHARAVARKGARLLRKAKSKSKIKNTKVAAKSAVAVKSAKVKKVKSARVKSGNHSLAGTLCAVLVIVLFSALYAAYHYWVWQGGANWGYRAKDYYTVSLIGYAFANWKNVGGMAVMLVCAICCPIVNHFVKKSCFKTKKSTPIAVVSLSMMVLAIAGQIALLFICKQKVEISTAETVKYAFWAPILFEVGLISILQYMTAFGHIFVRNTDYSYASDYDYDYDYSSSDYSSSSDDSSDDSGSSYGYGSSSSSYDTNQRTEVTDGWGRTMGYVDHQGRMFDDHSDVVGHVDGDRVYDADWRHVGEVDDNGDIKYY